MNMVFDAFIFDLDGVITDTAKYHYLAWKRLADNLGFEFTKQNNERLKGISRMQSLEILLEIGNKTLLEQEKIVCAEKKNNWYRELILNMKSDETLPGAIEFLNELKHHNKKISLGSASKNAKTIINQLQLNNYFDVIIDGNKVKNAKPNPEVFLLAAKELSVDANKCVVFEDSEAGVLAAKKSNMKCVGIGEKSVLRKADIVVKNLSHINLLKLQSFF